MVSALTLAQAAGGGGLNLDTGTVVAVVGAVLAALVSLFGLRLGARLAAIEKGQEGQASALDRLERRLDEGFARLTGRLDGLYRLELLPQDRFSGRPSAPRTGADPLELLEEVIGGAPNRRAEVEAWERLEETIRRALAAREDEPNEPPGEAS